MIDWDETDGDEAPAYVPVPVLEWIGSGMVSPLGEIEAITASWEGLGVVRWGLIERSNAR